MRGLTRGMRIVAYALMVVAAVVLVVQVGGWPDVTVWLWQLMCAWLAAGGALCLLGQLTRTWVGEYVGLPLAGSALLGFAILQGNVADWTPQVIPSLALLGAFGLLLFSRWRDVSALYRVAVMGSPTWKR